MDYTQAAFFLQGIALGLSAAATPGTLQSYLISQTLLGGWRNGIMVALAPLISDPLVVFTIVFLLDQIPNSIIQPVGILGGLFALYIAFGIYRQWKEANSGQVEEKKSGTDTQQNLQIGSKIKISDNFRDYLGIFTKGVIMNILSPGLYLYWFFITGPILLSALNISLPTGISFLAGFYIMMISGLLGIVFVFNFSRRFGPRVIRILTLISILILVTFAVILIAQGLYRFFPALSD